MNDFSIDSFEQTGDTKEVRKLFLWIFHFIVSCVFTYKVPCCHRASVLKVSFKTPDKHNWIEEKSDVCHWKLLKRLHSVFGRSVYWNSIKTTSDVSQADTSDSTLPWILTSIFVILNINTVFTLVKWYKLSRGKFKHKYDWHLTCKLYKQILGVLFQFEHVFISAVPANIDWI